jgi:hypothetical protein
VKSSMLAERVGFAMYMRCRAASCHDGKDQVRDKFKAGQTKPELTVKMNLVPMPVSCRRPRRFHPLTVICLCILT